MKLSTYIKKFSTPLENIQAFFDCVNEWKGEFK
jgi:hypothetical protein